MLFTRGRFWMQATPRLKYLVSRSLLRLRVYLQKFWIQQTLSVHSFFFSSFLLILLLLRIFGWDLICIDKVSMNFSNGSGQTKKLTKTHCFSWEVCSRRTLRYSWITRLERTTSSQRKFLQRVQIFNEMKYWWRWNKMKWNMNLHMWCVMIKSFPKFLCINCYNNQPITSHFVWRKKSVIKFSLFSFGRVLRVPNWMLLTNLLPTSTSFIPTKLLLLWDSKFHVGIRI